MKELNDLLEIVKSAEIQKAAGVGAGVGATLGATKGDLIRTTLVGAGVGAAIAWALSQYQVVPSKSTDVSQDTLDTDTSS